MFYKYGSKMKTIAKVLFAIGLIASVFVAIIFIIMGNDLNSSYATKGSGVILILSGIFAGVLGIVVSLTASLTIATLGNISDSVDSIAYSVRNRESQDSCEDAWVCKNCKEKNTASSVFCVSCGEHK